MDVRHHHDRIAWHLHWCQLKWVHSRSTIWPCRLRHHVGNRWHRTPGRGSMMHWNGILIDGPCTDSPIPIRGQLFPNISQHCQAGRRCNLHPSHHNRLALVQRMIAIGRIWWHSVPQCFQWPKTKSAGEKKLGSLNIFLFLECNQIHTYRPAAAARCLIFNRCNSIMITPIKWFWWINFGNVSKWISNFIIQLVIVSLQ